MSEQQQKWEIKTYNSQIADTGDYDGYYELTNGDISLITKDDLDEEDAQAIVNGLNNIGVKWEDWKLSDKEFNLYLMTEYCKDWKKVAKELYEELRGWYKGNPDEPLSAMISYEEALERLP